ncbi:terminase small subunit [Kiloniella laminariae]|uniref:Terminase small subunit n=1 Tax=Kiloniella laminariae TaxID=454162 RepID=A0ABT4LFW3_9PROT|nr:terminase small subunit [Kiloniella laminariae]MCZ4279984.1 terminase small subunit [Kiloniella laminariae]
MQQKSKPEAGKAGASDPDKASENLQTKSTVKSRVKPNTRLSVRQSRFVAEYLIDLNATQAAIRAGYSEAGAQQSGSRVLSMPAVRLAVDQALAERSERLKIDADYVLRGAVELFERCMQRSPVPDAAGEYKFQYAGAGKALELIGKHVAVQAFKERVDVGIESALMERLARGRKRVQGTAPDKAD